VTSLVYVVVVLFGQDTTPVSLFWGQDVAGICLCGLTAAVSVMISSSLVLPSLAGDEVSHPCRAHQWQQGAATDGRVPQGESSLNCSLCRAVIHDDTKPW